MARKGYVTVLSTINRGVVPVIKHPFSTNKLVVFMVVLPSENKKDCMNSSDIAIVTNNTCGSYIRIMKGLIRLETLVRCGGKHPCVLFLCCRLMRSLETAERREQCSPPSKICCRTSGPWARKVACPAKTE